MICEGLDVLARRHGLQRLYAIPDGYLVLVVQLM